MFEEMRDPFTDELFNEYIKESLLRYSQSMNRKMDLSITTVDDCIVFNNITHLSLFDDYVNINHYNLYYDDIIEISFKRKIY